MASSIPFIDIEDTSYLLRGVQDVSATRAQRGALVDGLTVGTEADAVARLDEAVSKFITDETTAFPYGTHKPPLDGVMARYFGDDAALVEARYGYSATSNPTKASFTFAPERRSYTINDYIVRRYIDGGSSANTWEDVTTDSTFTEDDGTLDVDLIKIRVPVKSILVPLGLLAASDLEGVDALEGYINTDAVIINERCRAPYTLKFMGVDELPINQNGTIKRFSVAEFEYLHTGWGSWRLTSYYTLAGTEQRRWTVRFDDPRYTATFTDAFPAFDPALNSGAGGFGTGPAVGTCGPSESA